ncbi:class I SAM-dependent methyltransferase [Bacillus sp. V5-8f]|uniref:class I SAM-dependent methyltransferase n=1 Tax=Bacillus sp. V5-8f TaxID=2053044 RepID=UPI000C760410|nr:class I SAM-dependent methyltransferase [Bacillus sp. V5-8f]PLT35131.1 SAM-dependent methyltransferase [Bacillus sp. V5-8f]
MKEKDDSIKKKVQEQFGKYAEKYVTSTTHSNGSDLALLPNWLKLKTESIVLDIATGGGHVVKAIAPYAAQVFATDLTLKMLETAKRHLEQTQTNVFYVIADAESLPFLDNTFDAVTCRIAPHHFSHPEEFVKEAARVLKQGGKFLLIDNVAPAEQELDDFVNKLEKLRDDSHVRSYSVKEWTKWLELAGLILLKAAPRKKTFTYPDWVRRTTTSEEQIKNVDSHVLSANEKIKGYFSIETTNGEIQSLTIDEWMVLAVKKHE